MAVVFRLDLRSLALLRIGLGIMLLADLAIRAVDFSAMYTPDGILPAAVLREHAPEFGIPPLAPSIHLWVESPIGTAALFAFAGIAAALLLVGWQTQWMALVNFLLLHSLQLRSVPILNGADDLLRLYLLWGMLLPLGARWSLDARSRGRKGDLDSKTDASGCLSVATVGLVMQVILLYAASGAYKLNPLWLEGRGLWEALHSEIHLRPAAFFVRDWTPVVTVANYLVIGLELGVPWLLLIPWRNAAIRLGVMAALLGMHLGIESVMAIGSFSWISAVGWMALIPTEVWDGRWASNPPLSDKPTLRSAWGWPGEAAATLALLGVLLLHATQFLLPSSKTNEYWVNRPASYVGLSQQWYMFSAPQAAAHWPVATAYVPEKSDPQDEVRWRMLDLFKDGAPQRWEKPPLVARAYPNVRWLKYWVNIKEASCQQLRRPLSKYLLQRWNDTHPDIEQAASVRISVYSEFAVGSWDHPDGHFESTTLDELSTDELSEDEGG